MTDLPNLPNLPTYLAAETFDIILARMLAGLKAEGIDTAPGSFAYDAEAPAAVELAQLRLQQREALKRAFARYTFGPYLEHIAEQRAGIYRRPAAAARTTLRFTGVAGAQVPAGTRVTTQLLPGATEKAVEYRTLVAAAVGAGGAVDVAAECAAAGTIGNVAQGALKVLITPLAGITGVSNPFAVGDGPADVRGTEAEEDADLLVRYLQAVRNPPGSGSRSDYARWAAEVPGVGGVYVQPRGYGPNTVRVVLVDADKAPAAAGLVSQVEDYLYAPLRLSRMPDQLTIGGAGVVLNGGRLVMSYDAGAAGVVTDPLNQLGQAGIWTGTVMASVDANGGAQDLLQVGIYNITAGTWAVTTPSGVTPAVITLRGQDLTAEPAPIALDYYWDGAAQLELRVIRLQTDIATVVYLDQVGHQSAFQREDAEPKAPCTARLYVEPAEPIWIDIAYHPTYAPGADTVATDAAVEASLRAYLNALTLTQDNDVRWVRVGSQILDTPGMLEYSTLTINGGAANIPIGPDQVAILRTVTRT